MTMRIESGEEVFTATIRLGNDAMIDRRDVAEALRRIARKLDDGEASGFFETILDDNGNDVGRWKLGVVR